MVIVLSRVTSIWLHYCVAIFESTHLLSLNQYSISSTTAFETHLVIYDHIATFELSVIIILFDSSIMVFLKFWLFRVVKRGENVGKSPRSDSTRFNSGNLSHLKIREANTLHFLLEFSVVSILYDVVVCIFSLLFSTFSVGSYWRLFAGNAGFSAAHLWCHL